MRRALVVAGVVLTVAAVGQAAIEVPLTVTDRAGVARVMNHVNSGVPLPMGQVKDVGELALYTADGQLVNAQIAERERWLKDQSLKFVTVHFLCDLPAGGSARYVLKTALAKPASTCTVEATDGAVTVDTGAVKFTVRKDGFNLLDQVWLSGKEVVPAGKAALTLVETHGDYTVQSQIAKLVSESEPTTCKVVAKSLEVEEPGPVRVVVKVTGQFVREDGQPSFDFLARIYALAGSASVRVAFTVLNLQGTSFSQFIGIRELSCTVPLKTAGDLNCTFGAIKDPDIAATASGTGKASLLQLASTEYTVNGKTYPGGRENLSRRLGWLNATDGTVGLAVGVRYFWQLYPKGLEVAGDGAVKVLIVAPSAERQPMFTGGCRTHEILFAFHDGRADGRARAMSVVDPLFAKASTDWYCQKTGAFGQLYDANPENFKPEYQEAAKAYEAHQTAQFESVLGRRDGIRQGIEEYGLFNFGSGVEHKDYVVKGSWLDTRWDGNYYDFPRAALIRWLRTGDDRAWDVAQDACLHACDIDVCHRHPANPKLNGIEHVCPNVGHFRQFWGGYPFGVSGNVDTAKGASMMELYALTGDAWYRDVGVLVGDYVSVHSGGALRAMGTRMTLLLAAYKGTGDRKYFDVLKGYVEKSAVPRSLNTNGLRGMDQGWMYGLYAEPMMDYYRLTGDVQAAKAIKVACDSLLNTGWGGGKQREIDSLAGFTQNVFGEAYEVTGNDYYLTKGLDWLKKTNTNYAGRVKSFAQVFRISPYFFTYLAKDYAPPKPVVTDAPITKE